MGGSGKMAFYRVEWYQSNRQGAVCLKHRDFASATARERFVKELEGRANVVKITALVEGV